MDHHCLNTQHLLATNQQGSQEQHLLSLDELIDDDSDDVAASVKDSLSIAASPGLTWSISAVRCTARVFAVCPVSSNTQPPGLFYGMTRHLL